MINPAYNTQGNSWADNVYFGRVSNFPSVFQHLLHTHNLIPSPKPHSEPRFREFQLDETIWEQQLGKLKVDSDYPALIVTLSRPDQGYSIETIETLYTFYVIRRLALVNPHMRHLQFEIEHICNVKGVICSVKKIGTW